MRLIRTLESWGDACNGASRRRRTRAPKKNNGVK